MIIRSATPDDAEIVCQMIHKLADFEGLSASCELTAEIVHRMLQEKNGLFALLAETENKTTIGLAAYFFIPLAILSGRTVLYLEDLWVEPAFRGKGIATKLFQHLEQIAKKQHCLRMEWKCLQQNTPAIAFYQAMHGNISDTWMTFMKTIS
ncbi:MAG: GNAT family N-acetyltransferase [Oscillospiraceae bacterium]|nr:GNAT family N-acetyltransferase [Oscillospiraceae bacterium]